MKFIRIEPGTFTMGSPADEPGRSPDDQERRVDEVREPYCLGVHEVTQEQYEAVGLRNRSPHKRKTRPFDTLTWDEAVLFCRRLSELPAEKKAGRVYRLPTEAEWECACRAGTDTAYSFGDLPLDDYVWHKGNTGRPPESVGKKQPNPWGFYDMHGNVWEFCAKWYDADTKTRKVARGGNVRYDATFSRSASRIGILANARLHCIGFRVVLEVPTRR